MGKNIIVEGEQNPKKRKFNTFEFEKLHYNVKLEIFSWLSLND